MIGYFLSSDSGTTGGTRVPKWLHSAQSRGKTRIAARVVVLCWKSARAEVHITPSLKKAYFFTTPLLVLFAEEPQLLQTVVPQIRPCATSARLSLQPKKPEKFPSHG